MLVCYMYIDIVGPKDLILLGHILECDLGSGLDSGQFLLPVLILRITLNPF